MKLFAKKPCSFNGRKFLIGDEIPVTMVDNPKAQEAMGTISIVNGESSAEEVSATQLPKIGEIEVPIRAEEGDLILCVTNEELIIFTDILQIGVSKAEDKQKISEMIQNIESEDLLILLDALDGRKHVKEEAEKRAAELHPAEDEEASEEPETESENEGEEEPGGDE